MSDVTGDGAGDAAELGPKQERERADAGAPAGDGAAEQVAAPDAAGSDGATSDATADEATTGDVADGDAAAEDAGGDDAGDASGNDAGDDDADLGEAADGDGLLAFPEPDPDRPGVAALPTPVGRELDEASVAATVELARGALHEFTSPDDVGEFAGFDAVDGAGDGVFVARFAATLAGYPGWFWTVAMVQLEDEDRPSVLETELLPGDDARLSPSWVPWAERLATYRAEHDAGARPAAPTDEADDAAPRARALGRRERRRVRKRATPEQGAVTAEDASPEEGAPNPALAEAAAQSGERAAEVPLETGVSETDAEVEARAIDAAAPKRSRRSMVSPRRRVTVANRAARRATRAQPSEEPGDGAGGDAGDERTTDQPETSGGDDRE